MVTAQIGTTTLAEVFGSRLQNAWSLFPCQYEHARPVTWDSLAPTWFVLSGYDAGLQKASESASR